MGKRKDSFKRDNRGMTLVELMCSIAIFACITAVIGSVLVVTAKTYRGGTAEASLQQEAQLAVNVIEGLIIDAGESVNYCYVDASDVRQDINSNSDIPTDDENCDRILEITNSSSMNNKVDIIYEVSTQRLMYQKTEAGVLGTAYLLAENITDFDADISNYDATHNIVLNIGMEKDSRKFEAEYNVTSRNDDVKANPYSPTPSVDLGIGITELVLEPNQVYELPVTVTATTGLSTDFTCTLYKEPTSTSTAVANCSDNKITITIGTEERGNSMNCMYLAVFSAATKADGTPMQYKTIPICIRRVEGLTVDMTQDDPTIGKYAAGTTYTVMSNITGTPFLGPRVNELDYECAYTVDWEYDFKIGGTATSTTPYFSFAEHDATNSTPAYVNVTLLTEMPANSKLTVKGKAMHPAGENKANAWYATIEDTDSLIRPGGGPTPITDTRFLRGDEFDFSWIETNTVINGQIKMDYTPAGKTANHYWFWRYREKTDDNSATWEPYRVSKYMGSDKFLHSDETWCLLPNKEYEIEFISALVNTTDKKLYWPKNITLLQPGSGFYEYGFTKGWTGGDYETPETEYLTQYTIGKANIMFGDSTAEAETAGIVSIGTEAIPVELQKSNVSYPNSLQKYLASKYLHHGKAQSQYKVYIEKNVGGTWQSCASAPGSIQVGGQFILVNNLTTVTADEDYRLLYYLDNIKFHVHTGDVMTPTYSLAAEYDYDMFDKSTGEGILYLRFKPD